MKAVIYGEDGEPIEGVEPTVIYTNIKTGLDVTTQAPVDAGSYMATAFLQEMSSINQVRSLQKICLEQ